MTVLEMLVTGLPAGWQVTDVYVGKNWIVALVVNHDGLVRAGVAATPDEISPQARFQIGHCKPNEAADVIVQRLLSQDITEAAVALATLNAINQPAEHSLTTDDAANWLSTHGAGRNVAIFGRFPFIDGELRPTARQIWVFEQHPQVNEFDSTAVPRLVPKADIVAITGSSVINHSIDTILSHVRPDSTVVLLGPSTPLSEKLFDVGIDVMLGVRVANVQQVVSSVVAGDGFQKMWGLQRVALFKQNYSLRFEGGA